MSVLPVHTPTQRRPRQLQLSKSLSPDNVEQTPAIKDRLLNTTPGHRHRLYETEAVLNAAIINLFIACLADPKLYHLYTGSWSTTLNTDRALSGVTSLSKVENGQQPGIASTRPPHQHGSE